MAGRKRAASNAFGQPFAYKKLEACTAIRNTLVSDTEVTRQNSSIFSYRKVPGRISKKHKKSDQPKSIGIHGMCTRAMTTEAVRNAVFSTPELLERIILHSPAPEILKLRLISIHWQIIIAKSPSIMRKMFLRSAFSPTTWIMDTHNGTLRPYSAKALEKMDGHKQKNRYLQSYPTVLNPRFFAREEGNAQLPLLYRSQVCETLHFTSSPELINRGSVCHAMYLSQPPIKSAVMSIQYFRRPQRRSLLFRRDSKLRLEVTNDHGLRYRDLLAAISAAIQQTTGEDEYNFVIRHEESGGHEKSIIWMLGATLASEEEIEAVEKTRVVKEVFSEETKKFIEGMGKTPSVDSGSDDKTEEEVVGSGKQRVLQVQEYVAPVSPSP